MSKPETPCLGSCGDFPYGEHSPWCPNCPKAEAPPAPKPEVAKYSPLENRLTLDGVDVVFPPAPPANVSEDFQAEVQRWLLETFGPAISGNLPERGRRVIEEALELGQSVSVTEQQATELVRYVFSRPVGEVAQEVGGVMVTTAALCATALINMEEAARIEIARCWQNKAKIQAKQVSKYLHGIGMSMEPHLEPENVSEPPIDWDDALKFARIFKQQEKGEPGGQANACRAYLALKAQNAALEAEVEVAHHQRASEVMEHVKQNRALTAELERLKRYEHRLYDRCPSCGNSTLFINPHGTITCSWIPCKAPTMRLVKSEIATERAARENAELRAIALSNGLAAVDINSKLTHAEAENAELRSKAKRYEAAILSNACLSEPDHFCVCGSGSCLVALAILAAREKEGK